MSDIKDAVQASNILVMNSYANAIAGAMARGAARGRMPSWQAVKAFNELQNIQTTIQFGDPSQYLTGQLNQALPANPTPAVVNDDPPAWAKELMKDVDNIRNKVGLLKLNKGASGQ